MLKKKRLGLYRAGHMTLPDEGYRSLLWADRLLKDLCDPNVTPRVPKAIRQRARDCLRHWPDTYYIDRLAEEAPDILYSSKPATDPLYRIVKEHTVK